MQRFLSRRPRRFLGPPEGTCGTPRAFLDPPKDVCSSPSDDFCLGDLFYCYEKDLSTVNIKNPPKFFIKPSWSNGYVSGLSHDRPEFNPLMVLYKFCGLPGTTSYPYLPLRMIGPPDTRSHPQGGVQIYPQANLLGKNGK